MKWYQRLRWLFLGHVAEVACEYDKNGDDILFVATMPFITAAMAAVFLLTTVQTFALGTIAGYIAAAVMALCAAIGAVMTVIAAAASVVYATQTTELPPGEEVVTRE
jgi:hypothetical protein